jgi:hypothetical protein
VTVIGPGGCASSATVAYTAPQHAMRPGRGFLPKSRYAR